MVRKLLTFWNVRTPTMYVDKKPPNDDNVLAMPKIVPKCRNKYMILLTAIGSAITHTKINV